MEKEKEELPELHSYNVVCPKPAYDRLAKAGLISLIEKQQEKIADLLLMGDFSGEIGEIIEQAKHNLSDKNRKISDRSEMFKGIAEFEADIDEYAGAYSDAIQRATLKHPSLLAYLVLGERVLDYETLGFPDRRSLEESIASFCIGERVYLSMGREWIWRNGIFRHEISQNIHGDLHASQEDVSGNDSVERTLFGDKERFDTMKVKDKNLQGVFACQDWSQFLVATLRYSQEIGKSREPVIVNWKLVLEKIGAVGTNSAEAEFGLGYNPVDSLFSVDVLTKGKKLRTMPLIIHGRETQSIPYIDNGNLTYLVEDKEGEIEINEQGRMFDEKKFRKVLEYTPQDLPEILKANYRFFARDRRLLPQIMDRFLEETR